ncbi:MAG: hypothetical protein WCK59_01365 [Candidatus Falkowbacteria bacterium]
MKSEDAKLLEVLKSFFNFVDLDADPLLPKGCTVKEHVKGGLKEIEEVALYFPEETKTVKQVLEENRQEFLANANFLDHLVAHKSTIYKEWEEYKLIFGATVYQNIKGELFVRYLFWDNVSWEWSFMALSSIFCKRCALVLLN